MLDSNRYKILAKIHLYIQKHGRSPSYNELSTSKGNAYWHVQNLVEEGLVERDLGATRSLRLTPKGEELAKLLVEYTKKMPHG